MSEEKSTTPQAADESALTDENLESVAGGLSLISTTPGILIPPIITCPGPTDPILEPICLDPPIILLDG